MGKLIAVTGRSLSLSGQSHPTLTYNIVETDISATSTSAEGKQILLTEIELQCTCSGDYGGGNTFQGSGNASIVASSQTVKCESQPVLLQDDQITITCTGTVTMPGSPPTTVPEQIASVTVSLNNTNQNSIFAS